MAHFLASSCWEEGLDLWLCPFLERLGRAKGRTWASLYLEGFFRPGEQKSVPRLAEVIAPGQSQQLHHFISASPWESVPLQELPERKVDRLVGIIDNTVLVNKGKGFVGVACQSSGELGKRANCQSLVSLTLAQAEVPIPVARRLYLPTA